MGSCTPEKILSRNRTDVTIMAPAITTEMSCDQKAASNSNPKIRTRSHSADVIGSDESYEPKTCPYRAYT